jgi:hypothetical protein
MNRALVQELENLLRENSALLACPEPDVALWKRYGERRGAIFARLKGMDFSTEGDEGGAIVTNLIREILGQDTAMIVEAQARLTHLREELSGLATARRALKSYTPPHLAVLFKRCT